MSVTLQNMRNIAIIAHVDHGKTTLVDHMLKQAGLFRDNQHTEERMMDKLDLEKERGITIQAKNASFTYKGVKVNIVDTPGHSDFGGEVERILNMVDGAILLVDASEGPLPQTRFVLRKALEQNIKIIVCINKIDRPDARIEEVHNEIFDLFIDLDASDEQADFDTIYAVGREGYATLDPKVKTENLSILFDWILEKMPAPKADVEAPLQMMIANIDYNDYVGRLGIGRIFRGTVRVGDDVILMQENGQKKFRVTALYGYQGMNQVVVPQASAGDIAIIAGMEEIFIGDTIAAATQPEALVRLKVEEPTVGMMFTVNNSPFAGKEGTQLTSRKIAERLERELRYNVALKIEETAGKDAWKVLGRGELQLGILIEQMRREGFELLVSKPKVLFKTIDGVQCEPFESAVIDIDEDHVGVVTEKLGLRKGVMTDMNSKGTGRTRITYKIPSRGLIGYRSEFLTDTRGLGLLNTQFIGFEPYAGDIFSRLNGAMISDRVGRTTAYALDGLQPRGRLFVAPGTEVYEGMVVGENSKDNDLDVNCTREKKLTNMRASGSDDAVRLAPVKPMSLEFAMEWISDDELIEVTPKNIRIRCVELNPHKRKK